MARYTNSVPQIFDKNKVAIVGAKKFFFEPGTTTFKTIYSDSAFTIPASNPQLSDADGRFSDDIFLDGIYKEVQQDNAGTTSGFDGNTLWTKDPIGDIQSGEFGLWSSSTIYSIPDKVVASDDFSYESLTDSNQGNDPVSSPLNWARITYVKAGVLDGVSEIKDTNSLTSIILTPTASAVNHAEITNAATGGDPKVAAIGADANINLELGGKGTGGVELLSPIVDDAQNEIIKVASTASAVNELTVTNAATGNGPTLSATGDDTNIDVNIDPKGDGHLVIGGSEVYEQVILNTPVLLATDTSTTATGNTLVDITAQTTGVAVRAILNIYINASPNAALGNTEVLVGEGDETLATAVHRAVFVEYTSVSTSPAVAASNQITVNLASGEIFDYQILQTGTAPSSRTVSIYLAGYYR